MSGLFSRRLVAFTLVAVAGCSPHRPVAAPSVVLTPGAPAKTGASPRVASSPVATASSIATPTQTPSPTLPAKVVLAPNAPPRILNIALSSTQFGGGDMVSGTVSTSSNVASVEARIATYSIVVPKTGVGKFSLHYQVPSVPFFLHGNYTMQFIARNSLGVRAERDIPISIR